MVKVLGLGLGEATTISRPARCSARTHKPILRVHHPARCYVAGPLHNSVLHHPTDNWHLQHQHQQESPRPSNGGSLATHMSMEETSAFPDSPVLHPMLCEVPLLEDLMMRMKEAGNSEEKVSVLLTNERVKSFLQLQRRQHPALVLALLELPPQLQYLLLTLPAIGQAHVLITRGSCAAGTSADGHVGAQQEADVSAALHALASSLIPVELFYDSIGGLVGYQLKSLQIIIAAREELSAGQQQQAQAQGQQQRQVEGRGAAQASMQAAHGGRGPGHVMGHRYHVPHALDLAGEGGREVGQQAAAWGLKALPRMAEIYPVGGAGDRLGLTCEVTGECLPAAMLPYCGRTMMEGIVRDLQAREYLHYKVTGRQLTTPVAVMTSDAKGNHRRMSRLLEEAGWFGRDPGAFKLFRQPLVPVISAEDGKWLLSGVMRPMTKPGGHGAIWKLMRDEGVFDWLRGQGREAAIVRQISNPMAGMDTTLLALAGYGQQQGGAFGFMSCDRTLGAQEGMNVLQERTVVGPDGRVGFEYGYTNIEYTEFERLGICDVAAPGSSSSSRQQQSAFPANTNVLYVGLEAAQAVVDKAVADCDSDRLMPGLIFNLHKSVQHTCPLTGQQERVRAGRMESTMQNIADCMTDRLDAPLLPQHASQAQLSTFLVYNMRRKVTSSAKKRREPGTTKISQTPDGSFFDLQRNAWHLLQQCGLSRVPELGDVQRYLERGPGFIFLYHPALGPLWDVVSQKLQGGWLADGAELVLEVAEARLRDVGVEGSLLVHADSVMGHMQDAPPSASSSGDNGRLLRYSQRCGRVHLTHVVVRNAGIDWAARGNVYWKHQVERHEALRIHLHGCSEFEAHNVTITGNHSFEVPDHHRMVVTAGARPGELSVSLMPLAPDSRPTWEWQYVMDDVTGAIRLVFKGRQVAPKQQRQLQQDIVISSLGHGLLEVPAPQHQQNRQRPAAEQQHPPGGARQHRQHHHAAGQQPRHHRAARRVQQNIVQATGLRRLLRQLHDIERASNHTLDFII